MMLKVRNGSSSPLMCFNQRNCCKLCLYKFRKVFGLFILKVGSHYARVIKLDREFILTKFYRS